MAAHEHVVILDMGSQFTQLIARRTRELGVYSEILPHTTTLDAIKARGPKAVILSGGPASVYGENAPRVDEAIFTSGLPVLGICYGMQLGSQVLGGRVEKGKVREFGHAELEIRREDVLLAGMSRELAENPDATRVWMSHGDKVTSLPADFETLAVTPDCEYAAVKHRKHPFFGVQFHPEVRHSVNGMLVLKNFLFNVARCKGDWQMSSFIEEQCERIRNQVGRGHVICGLSGGVDSSVVAALIARAIPGQLTCIMVDNGLLRTGEVEEVRAAFEGHFRVNLVVADAAQRFLGRLEGVSDPDEKRKIIGEVFIRVFEQEARKVKDARFLAQGTLYPDVIESVAAHGGPTAMIKRHHNVGGLPADMQFELVEPLRFLFKDEVREVGKELGLPDALVWRQPFPGPGLAVRCLGEITPERLSILRAADLIVRQEVEKAGLTRRIWQAFAVLLPVKSIGVMGDERTHEYTCAVRAVESVDGMTADWARLDYDLLRKISNRIINEVRGFNRVVYDISSKPPATIEWE
ncbi:MAG: glutamine-hydrolyzing GMP synthase [Planctomycetes bacterium]|jgi:GMP synthase (glutamine-hydrolysing)|nr:glutamine-hydrolyzing GMP synthase [Planctomycetota bacterium]MCL4731426.1 glutamine-hydrolyzing GMP synthase [Planctomycetota bacterium]